MTDTLLVPTSANAPHSPTAAHFAQMREDVEAYPDVMDPAHRRAIFPVLSPTNRKAAVRAPHAFHICYLEARGDKGPPLHSHDYPEIFMVLRGRFRFQWGDHGEHHADLGALDLFSVPPGVMRNFHALDGQDAMLMCIFDTTLVDPDDGIVISQPFKEASEPGKYDCFRAGYGRDMDEQQIQPYLYWHRPHAEGAPRVRGVIGSGNEAAAIRTAHSIDLDMVFPGEEPMALPFLADRMALIVIAGEVTAATSAGTSTLALGDVMSLDADRAAALKLTGSADASVLLVRERGDARG